GPRVDELLLRGVVPVGDPRGAAGGEGGEEALARAGPLQGRLEVGDVRGDRLVAGVGQRAGARGEGARIRVPGPDPGGGVGVGLGEAPAVAAVEEAGEARLARLGPDVGGGPGGIVDDLQTAGA